MPPEVSTVGGQRSVAELRRELAEAREQQAATATILTAISNASTDVDRVFAEIAASAARLCEAHDAALVQLSGGYLQLLAHRGPLPVGPVRQGGLPLTRGSVMGRAVADKDTIHVADLQAETEEYPEGSEIARRLGHHTIVAVPLMRAGEAIGAIVVRRTEVRPFTDRQIDLLKTFADQAVIAIENRRLFEAEQARTRELSEALEQQTAADEVLRVISSSPCDPEPVFQAMLAKAVRICETKFGILWLSEGDRFRSAALHGLPPALAEARQREPLIRFDANSPVSRAASSKRVVHINDAMADPAYKRDPASFVLFELGDARTSLFTPMLREAELIGVITIYRQEVRPFTDKQVELITSFANQGVIAIENARLFEEVQARTRELQESLEYQTATSDVLSVISRSPNELQPVLEAIVETARRLCQSDRAMFFQLRDGRYHLSLNVARTQSFSLGCVSTR